MAWQLICVSRFTAERHTHKPLRKGLQGRDSSTYVPGTTNADRYPHNHASVSRLRLRGSYGTIEWMMRTESSPMYMTLGIGISTQLSCIMP